MRLFEALVLPLVLPLSFLFVKDNMKHSSKVPDNSTAFQNRNLPNCRLINSQRI